MREAKVGIFEDHKLLRQSARMFLEMSGHAVVLEVGSMPEAREVIPQLDPRGLDVAVVDGNLGPYSSGADGAEIARLLRANFQGLVIIGFSGTDTIEGVDMNIPKGNGLSELTDAIDRL